MENHETLLATLGLSAKAAHVYLTLLEEGPSSVRQLASHTDVNRGTVYDALKELKTFELAKFFNEETKQFFVAAPPSRLREIVAEQTSTLRRAEQEMDALIPKLETLYNSGERNPAVRMYEEAKGIRAILEDVLTTMESADEKEYYVYSSSAVRDAGLYASFPDYTERRLEQGIHLKNISLGPGGGTAGLDERKWVRATEGAPTYILIYGGKVANIFLDPRHELMGLIIENAGIYETQRLLFRELWDTIPSAAE